MKTVALVLALVTSLAVPSHAYLEWRYALPTTVQVGTLVEVKISGLMPDPCWDFMGGVCHAPAQGVAQANVVIWRCDVHPPGNCGVCGYVLVPYEYTCVFVFDTPGSYVIRAIEYAEDSFGGRSLELTHELEVVDGVAEEAVSWSRVKGIYR